MIIAAEVEEFEQGSWVADLTSFESFSGSFAMAGSTWVGTKVTERLDFSKYHTRVVGGAGKLATVIPDRYYSGSVSLAAAVEDVCRESGESFGSAAPGLFLTTYERLRGTAAAALDQIAKVFGLIWWIDRAGKVNVKAARDKGASATGTRISSDVDASIVLVEPSGVQVGVDYSDDNPASILSPIRHVRWVYTDKRVQAHLYPMPFIFRLPSNNEYLSLRSARVDRQNADGTVDVIADARFGVTRVPLFCGVPGSKVEVRGGEEVMLGFFGGDPQKPYCVAMAQNTSATKAVARKGDVIKIPSGTILSGVATGVVTGTSPSFQLTLGTDAVGVINGGSDRMKVGD